jgi:alpha-galactosidase
MEKVHEESIVDMIESIACDVPRRLIVNVANKNDYMPGVPRDFEVEVPAIISAQGVQPIVTAPLPRSIIAHTLRDRVAPTEMELYAYSRGSRKLLVELILMDRWVQSEDAARAFVDEILAMDQHEALRRHYQ